MLHASRAEAPDLNHPEMQPSTAVVLGVLSAAAAATGVSGQSEPELFRQHERSIFKVEVIETLSETAYVIGSAFVADSTGRLVTNYHVVNDAVFSPDDYALRLLAVDGTTYDAEILAVDPVNDLAIIRSELRGAPALAFVDEMPAVGDPVFSLGFPSDLSGTLVPGTFSGSIERSMGNMLHYSGSLSPGMSGGPTLDGSGRVVGVNVATSGNQLSYLVSAEAASALLSMDRASDGLLDQARRSLNALQGEIRETFLDGAIGTRTFDDFEVAALPEEVADCTASPLRPDGYVFSGVIHDCGPTDAIWLDPDGSVSPLLLRHVLLVAEGMSRLRFAGLYSDWFQAVREWAAPESQWASPYACTQRNVTNDAGVKLRLSQCWRRREGLDGLYDLFAKMAVLGVSDRGLVTTIVMQGTTPENGRDMVLEVVEGVRWHR